MQTEPDIEGVLQDFLAEYVVERDGKYVCKDCGARPDGGYSTTMYVVDGELKVDVCQTCWKRAVLLCSVRDHRRKRKERERQERLENGPRWRLWLHERVGKFLP